MSTAPASSSSPRVACDNACRRQSSFFFFPRCIWAQNSTTTTLRAAGPQATVNVWVTVREVSEHFSRAEFFSQDFVLCDFLDRSAAEKTTRAMLSDMIRECKSTLSRPLSLFIHYAAVEAQREKKGLECLSLAVLLYVKRTHPRVEEGALAAAPVTAVNVSCLQEFGEERQLGTSCPVCLDDFTFSARECLHFTACGHVFHCLCFLRWLKRSSNAHCPLCRFNFDGLYKSLI